MIRTLALVLSLVVLFGAAGREEWRGARPDYAWSFPEDHWAHPDYRTEWWYFTGHLGHRFAYQLTFFRVGLLRDRPSFDSDWTSTGFVMGHAAVTDIEAGKHYFSETLYREIPLLAGCGVYPDPRIVWSRPPPGTEGVWSLDWNGAGFDFSARDESRRFGLRLTTRPTKPLVLQGPNGFSRKGAEPTAASLYYSFTRLETTGEVEVEGNRFEVSGESWMDQEISSSELAPNQVGWDWLSLQLDDGRDVMLYLMRREDGNVDYANGTIVDASGAARYLGRADIEVEVLDRWASPESDARYPSRWRARFGEEEILVEPLVADQENRSRLPGGVHYWEGAVRVATPEGKSVGRGFVELTGYGRGNRPPV
jgi:predicted secreted hydrolase